MFLLRLPGRAFLSYMSYLGQLSSLVSEIFIALGHGVFRLRLTAYQLVAIGYGSQVVVIVTGAFTGAVMCAQSYFEFKTMGVENAVGAVVAVSMFRELGPVMAGLMVSGRVGAAMAAEIGTMKVTEQIDALRAMAVHPVDYLVVPRFIAMMVSMPLLIAESITFSLVAAYIVAVWGFNIPSPWFYEHVKDHINMTDVFYAMIKGFVFGILITVISCHQGLTVKEGAVGVGNGTTRAVVYSSLAILIFNFFLTMLLNNFFPMGNVAP